MNRGQMLQLEKVNNSDVINEEDKKILPGIHWCPDWDYLPVFDNSPEKVGCTCGTSQDQLELDLRIEEEQACSTHPNAPHGFNRNSSHSLGRYVCDCEGWQPDE